MSRYIDSLPTPARVLPKKLIVLSAPRTGTHGLYSALKILGFKPYHMVEAIAVGAPAIKILNDGMRGELGLNEPFTRKEFDKWFADYDVIIEMPFFMLQSTINAYPDAKFLLVVRSPEKWAKSMENTVGMMTTKMMSFPGSWARYFDATAAAVAAWSGLVLNRCTKGAGMTAQGKKNMAEFYSEYVDTVKKSVPPKQLEVMSLEDGLGWEEICPFLGVPKPDREWPGRNTPDEFKQLTAPAWGKAMRKTVVGVTTILGVAITAGVWYRRAGGKLPSLSLVWS